MMRTGLIALAASLALACGSSDPSSPGNGAPNGDVGTPPPGTDPADELVQVSPEQTEVYLGKLAPSLVQRVLTPAERAQISTEGGAAIRPILAAWLQEPGFIKSARRFIELGLQVSGQKNDVNFDLPGNIVEYVVSNARPWSEILTSETCYDAALQPIACDTGAPYTAGVLTTRAFMISRASRFNLTRSSALLRNFACQVYPQEETLQPRIDRGRLIPMFQADTAEEQTDERAKSGFGNGLGCYSCHGQFSLHSQLYVKFDHIGLYVPNATGLQDPEGELGRSVNGLMASHLQNPAEAASEQSNMFGQTVMNLKDAARVVASQSTFAPCAARRFLDFTLGVPSGSIDYDERIFEEVVIATQATDPTLQAILLSLFTHPVVIESVTSSLNGAP
jgi:hypothetical protein